MKPGYSNTRRGSGKPRRTPRSRRFSPGQKIAIAGIISAVLVGLVGSVPAYLALRDDGDTTPTTTTRPPIAAITVPRDEQRGISVETDVKGTSQNLSPGQEIWVFVLPSNGVARYYPENRAPVEANGEWKLRVRLGGDKHRGKPFDILAVITLSERARKELAQYNACRQTSSCRGIETLPDDVIVSHQITVIRA
jgi:hypothetical protein